MHIPARVKHAATVVFGVDLRTLALFRFVFGLYLVLFALGRACDLAAFYTDAGLLPRTALLALEDGWRISLLMASGGTWFASLLLAATFVAALAFAFGWRTRAMAIALFVLFGSFASRNPLVLQHGDMLVQCLLFWSMFLPLSARWSFDAAFASNAVPERNLHVSWAGAGLLLQVLLAYFFNAWLRSGAEWSDGTAVYYALELERTAAPLGLALLKPQPALMQALTYASVYIGWFAPLLALSPVLNKPLRSVALVLLVSLEAALILFFDLGAFPWISLVALTLLISSRFWDRRVAADEQHHPNGPKIYYDEGCAFCLRTAKLVQHFLWLPRARIAPAQESQRVLALMTANDSWVVIDASDVAHVKMGAFTALVRVSPVLGFMYPLLAALEKPGDALYALAAKHRARLAAATTGLLATREVRFETGVIGQRIAGAFLFLVIAWNLVTVNVLPARIAGVTAPLMQVLRIDQRWDLYAPAPSKRDGWMVFPGKLADGTEVDVLKPGEPLSWEKPATLSAQYPSAAWQAYRWRLLEREYAPALPTYVKFLCREWNSRAAGAERLVDFEMALLEERSPPPGETPMVERRRLGRHECQ